MKSQSWVNPDAIQEAWYLACIYWQEYYPRGLHVRTGFHLMKVRKCFGFGVWGGLSPAGWKNIEAHICFIARYVPLGRMVMLSSIMKMKTYRLSLQFIRELLIDFDACSTMTPWIPPGHAWARKYRWSLAGTLVRLSYNESHIWIATICASHSTLHVSLEAVCSNQREGRWERSSSTPSRISSPTIRLTMATDESSKSFMILLLHFIHDISITSRRLPAYHEITSLEQFFPGNGGFSALEYKS